MNALKMAGPGVIAASVLLSAAPLHAEDYDPRSGMYQSDSGQNLSVLLTPLSEARYAIDITTTVPMTGDLPGCGGGISGELVIEAEAETATLEVPNEGFVASEPVSQTNQEFCRINLQFLDAYTLRMEEVSGCTYYHGAACSFSGDVVHDASGI